MILLKTKYIFLFAVVLNSIIFSQQDEQFKYSILISSKAGYHSGFKPDRDYGFPGGFVWDAGLQLVFSNSFIVGFNLELWNKNNISRPYKGDEDISAISYSVNYRFRKSIFKIADLYIGAGLGNYSISRKYSNPLHDNQISNFAVFLLFGTNVKVYKNLFVTAECNLTGLIDGIDYGGGEPSPTFSSIKIGPTFLFKFR